MAMTRHPTGANVAQPATHRVSPQRRILTVLFIVSFALDFKGSTGGSPLQMFMMALNTIAFLMLAVSFRMVIPRKGFVAFLLWGWGSFLIIGSLGALISATPFGHYIRIAYAFVLFLEGFLVAWWIARDSRDAGMIVSAMMATAVVSLFFTFWWGFFFTGLSREEIRYQILSPLIPLLLVVAGYDLIFARRRKLWSFALLGIVLGMVALSVTRGPLLIVGLVAGLVLLAALRNALRTMRIPGPFLRGLIVVVIMAAVGLSESILFNPDILGRWMHRSVGAAQDVTFWTRIAAIEGQFQALTSNQIGWLIGQGFGSSYPWPVTNFPWILQYMGAHAIGRSVWFPGEFMWSPFVYYGGFIFGPIAALVLLRGALHTYRILVMLLRAKSWRDARVRPLWVGVLGYLAFLVMGFTANPFILRLAALFMGLCLGIVVAQNRFAEINNSHQ